jgi:hypothetical protein
MVIWFLRFGFLDNPNTKPCQAEKGQQNSFGCGLERVEKGKDNQALANVSRWQGPGYGGLSYDAI